MTEYSCSVCGYSSLIKHRLDSHLERKKSCGPGIKEIIQTFVEIKCEFCNKLFSNPSNLKYHIKNNCKQKNTASLARIKELEEQLKESQKVTNITNNNYIIVVNNYEETSLEKLTDKTYNKLLKDSEAAHQIIPKLIKQIHFDQKTPENHNILLTNRNKNNKHLQIYKNGHWEITDKSTEIDNLINDKETNLSDWVTEKGQKYPEAMDKFNEYLDQKYDEDSAKLMKEEVEMLLYNNRHMVKQ
jgi:anion-transporting  ArsA/GET3 family ATPase